MALYMSPARRRRSTILAAVGALVVGVLVGVLIGRGSAPTIEDRVTEGREAGRRFAAALRVLPLEYEQAVAGDGSESGDAVAIVDRSLAGEQTALDAAPWLGESQIAALGERLDVLRDGAADDMAPADFELAVEDAATAVEDAFGVARTESPG